MEAIATAAAAAAVVVVALIAGMKFFTREINDNFVHGKDED